MTNIVTPQYSAEAFRERVDLFCFTDIRLDITPAKSLLLQEQLLRISDLLIGIINTYFDPDIPCRYDYIMVKSDRLSKRFRTISRILDELQIDQAPLVLFKRELATEVYQDCVKLKDTDLYDALNSFLYKRDQDQQPRHQQATENN